MSRITVVLPHGADVTVRDLPDVDTMALVEAFRSGAATLSIALDDKAVTHINSSQVMRIDVDFD